MSQRSAPLVSLVRSALAALLCLFLLVPGAARAQSAGGPALGEPLAQQQSQLERQERLLLEQQRVIEQQRAMLQRQESLLSSLLGNGGPVSEQELAGLTGRGAEGPLEPEQAAGPAAAVVAPVGQVGQAPPEEQRKAPEIVALREVGSQLTPRGRLVIEPSQQFGATGINRFSFQGVEVADSVLVGLVDASDADRGTLTSALSARYGITNRFEVDMRVPFVMRSDTVTRRIVSQSTQTTESDSLRGRGLGDIEFGSRYQLTYGENGWPFLIANLRVKTASGSNPFEVARNSSGIATELATGSGFWTVSPSITAISYSDPAVFFANLSYNWNLARNVGARFSSDGGDTVTRIGRVDPGNSVGVSFGMTLALNERASFNLGYDHQFIGEGSTQIDTCGGPLTLFKAPVNARNCRKGLRNESLQVGSFLFGLSYATKRGNAYSVLLALGATEDAPDMSLTFRAPLSFDGFDRFFF